MNGIDELNSHEEQNTNNCCPAQTDRQARIRALNDRLRIYGAGGIVLMTEGVAALEVATPNAVFGAIAAYDEFREENDPWNEHDFGVVRLGELSVFWKIDYYDRSRTYLSPDPADPKVTVRVLTVMRADEY